MPGTPRPTNPYVQGNGHLNGAGILVALVIMAAVILTGFLAWVVFEEIKRRRTSQRRSR